jgi:hypothetical protein
MPSIIDDVDKFCVEAATILLLATEQIRKLSGYQAIADILATEIPDERHHNLTMYEASVVQHLINIANATEGAAGMLMDKPDSIIVASINYGMSMGDAHQKLIGMIMLTALTKAKRNGADIGTITMSELRGYMQR